MTDTAVKTRSSFPSLRPNRRQLMACGCGMALIATCVSGARWWTTGRFMIETDDAYVRADVVTIAPRVAGNVVAVVVADNQRVRAGDVLARIDDRDYRLRAEQAEGAVASAKADVEAQQARIATFNAQTTQQQSVIEQNGAAITAREADAHFADLEYQRQSNLSRQKVGSIQNLQSAEAVTRKASATLAEARATLAASRAYLPVLATQRDAATADLDKARGALQQAQAALDAARLDLERTVIRAPVDGQVGQRTVRAGQYADIGTPLMAVVPAQVYVVANYKETQTDRIRPGQSAVIVVDAFGGVAIKGHVDDFAPATGAQFALLPPDNATGNFTKIVQRMPLRIMVDPGQPRAAELRPGMSVETTVYTGSSRP
ncbi:MULTISPECIES: HlyD family secretion protein [Nitrospirillum]|uniref:Membrane fusion protein (Multidrug efflux system) n=1 Tax=Nitrospirillum amazonense TaxID=28077 RepID=A0A560FNJ1_9PROT|nr:HlyD family secretion protein [Nitrospirillum amazonense]MEC4593837.1 HlyD family secretion protein [Nitrospirillum amazonense]TWB23185.1 membrane fusion protein (multidrug efflux system) [Nitrospirillum amazonense]